MRALRVCVCVCWAVPHLCPHVRPLLLLPPSSPAAQTHCGKKQVLPMTIVSGYAPCWTNLVSDGAYWFLGADLGPVCTWHRLLHPPCSAFCLGTVARLLHYQLTRRIRSSPRENSPPTLLQRVDSAHPSECQRCHAFEDKTMVPVCNTHTLDASAVLCGLMGGGWLSFQRRPLGGAIVALFLSPGLFWRRQLRWKRCKRATRGRWF